MLLCDAAQSVGGKLYILGAGWSQMLANNPTDMSLAIKLLIPWSRTNEPVNVRASLLNRASAEVVDFGMGPVRIETAVELGRPPGMARGTPLDASLVMNFPGVRLAPGNYVWELEVGGTVKARIPVQALSQS
jgi:hypothetical protein